MRFIRTTRKLVVNAGGGIADAIFQGMDRPFIDLTIWGVPQTEPVVVNAKYASSPANITGVSIIGVSNNTADGIGTLSFTAVGTLLAWQAPGAGAPGPAQNVGAGGTFVLAGGDGSTITVEVVAGSLPVGNQVDNITISTTFPTAKTRNFTSQLFFGPTAQTAPVPRANDAVYLIYDPGDVGRVWPTYEPSSNPQQKGTSNQVHGFPITVRITNLDPASKLVITVEILSMSIDQG